MGFSCDTKNPRFIYLPSFEAEFLQPEIALTSLQLITKKASADCWLNTACGLFEYVYGDLRQSRKILRRLIRKHRCVKKGSLPLVTDSLDVYHFLIQAPQLFSQRKHLALQAKRFAKQVRFITDFFPKKISVPTDIKGPVQLDYGSLFCREAPLLKKALHYSRHFLSKIL